MQQPRTTMDAFGYDSENENDTASDSDQIDIPEQLEDDEDTVLYGNSSDTDEEFDDTTDDSINDTVGSDNESGNGEENDEDDDNNELIELHDIRDLIRQLINRVRACVNNIRSTRAVLDYVQIREKTSDPPIKAGLITDLEIRWNTTFVMIDRFTTHRLVIDDINSRPFKIPDLSSVQQLKLSAKRFEFTNDNWCAIHDLHTALKPFFSATNVISAKSYPTLAAVHSGESSV